MMLSNVDKPLIDLTLEWSNEKWIEDMKNGIFEVR